MRRAVLLLRLKKMYFKIAHRDVKLICILVEIYFVTMFLLGTKNIVTFVALNIYETSKLNCIVIL